LTHFSPENAELQFSGGFTVKHSGNQEKVKVRINCEITGESARFLLELKRRGLASSNREVVVQALRSLRKEVLERDLQEAKLKASQRLNEEEF